MLHNRVRPRSPQIGRLTPSEFGCGLRPTLSPDKALQEVASLRRTVGNLVGDLREEFEALQELLEEANVISSQWLSARLHRRRFTRIAAAHPCEFEGSLPQTAELIVRYLTPPDAQALPALAKGASPAAVALNRIRRERRVRLYVCGGFVRPNCLSSVECFDADTETASWAPVAPMLQVRDRASAAVVAGRLYICGGTTEGQAALRSVERYDPETGVWEAMPNMAHARRNTSAAVVAGRLYVCGGSDEVRSMRSVERFDPAQGVWEAMPRLLQERARASTVAVKGCLYVCGGHAWPRALNSVERLVPPDRPGICGTDLCSWEVAPPMLQGRWNASAAVINGRFYVCAGHSGQRVLSSVERFDPDAGAWESMPAMLQERTDASAAVVAGRLYVCGGSDAQRAVKSVERFDPEAGTWSSMPPMLQERTGASAAALAGSNGEATPRPRSARGDGSRPYPRRRLTIAAPAPQVDGGTRAIRRPGAL